MTVLDGWENFYIIVGPSAGALIGLQFVVITLIADTPAARADEMAGSAFTTPSVVHFELVLLLSALVSIPWQGLGTVSILWGLMGLFGLIYSIIVARRMRLQTAYQPVFEDWLFHLLLPLVAYLGMGAAACIAGSHERPALFLIATAALLLLFIGIHNAWDTVTYHVFSRKREHHKKSKE